MRRIPWKPHVVQLEPESDFLDHGTGLVALNIVRKRVHHESWLTGGTYFDLSYLRILAGIATL